MLSGVAKALTWASLIALGAPPVASAGEPTQPVAPKAKTPPTIGAPVAIDAVVTPAGLVPTGLTLSTAMAERWSEAARQYEAKLAAWDARQGKAAIGTPAPVTIDDRRRQLALVVQMVKKMKPTKAAAVVAEWPDGLAVDILARLGARSSSPILAAMPPKHAAQLTTKLVAAGPPTPIATTTDTPSKGDP